MPKPNPTKRSEVGQLLPVEPWLHRYLGERFARLVVIGYGGRKRGIKKMVVCQCDCGMYIDVPPVALVTGNTSSCGCAHNDYMQKHNATLVTHGHARGGTVTPEYRAWRAMIDRCHSKTHEYYRLYGARGIHVCARWREDFEHFLEDMGPRPTDQHSLGRIDNAKGYSSDNCRWETSKEQQRNTRANHLYLYEGDRKSIAEWAEKFDLPYDTLYRRLIVHGWNMDRAITEPVGGGGRAPQNTRTARRQLYAVWLAILDRCHNPSNQRFARYGGRGIYVADEWRDSFDTFRRDVGDRPSPRHTIDRIDNNLGYRPDNVRWATAKEQNRNRSNTKRYTLFGESKSLAEWADLAGQRYELVRHRVHDGWTLNEALGTPEGARGLESKRKWR